MNYSAWPCIAERTALEHSAGQTNQLRAVRIEVGRGSGGSALVPSRALRKCGFKVALVGNPNKTNRKADLAGGSSLASCFEHSRFKRLLRSRAGPGHKLKRRVIALACLESGGQQRLALYTRHVRATGKHERMTK